MRFDEVRQRIEAGIDFRRLLGLHQPQVPLREHHGLFPRQGTDDRKPRRFQRLRSETHVARTTGAIEHDACNRHALAEALEAASGGRRRLRLAGNIEYQDDWPTRLCG